MPRVTATFAAIMLVCFAGQRLLDPVTRSLLESTLGVSASSLLLGRFWTFLTYPFFHGSFAHIALNLLALIGVGPEIERIAGSWRTFVLCLTGALLGAVAWLASVWPLDSSLIGSSAAVSALLGALAALRPSEKYALIFLPVPLPAWLIISALAATQLAHAIAAPAGGRVAYIAHIAGGLTGFLIALVFRRNLPVALSITAGNIAARRDDG